MSHKVAQQLSTSFPAYTYYLLVYIEIGNVRWFNLSLMVDFEVTAAFLTSRFRSPSIILWVSFWGHTVVYTQKMIINCFTFCIVILSICSSHTSVSFFIRLNACGSSLLSIEICFWRSLYECHMTHWTIRRLFCNFRLNSPPTRPIHSIPSFSTSEFDVRLPNTNENKLNKN